MAFSFACPSALEITVFVEDTDAYEVLYHNNYAKYALRGIWAALGGGSGAHAVASALLEESSSLVNTTILVQRFLVGAILGARLAVNVTLTEVDDESITAYVNITGTGESAKTIYTDILLRIACEDDMGPCPLPGTIVENANKCTGDLPAFMNAMMGLRFPHAQGPNLSCVAGPRARQKCYNLPFYVQPDECDDAGTNFLSNRSVVNFFERGRNLIDADTGKSLLGRLKDEGQLIVVARFDNVEFGQRPHRVGPGAKVEVRTAISLLNKKTQLMHHQSLWLISRDGTGEAGRDDVLLASGFVLCACVNRGEMKPMPIVSWWEDMTSAFCGMST